MRQVVRARIDGRTRRGAAAALKRIGLILSDAFPLLLVLVRVAAEKALPSEPLNPRAGTVAAMKAARRGDLVRAGTPLPRRNSEIVVTAEPGTPLRRSPCRGRSPNS
jgi:DNA-damage-inducible protein J